jgi:hypothetical protein
MMNDDNRLGDSMRTLPRTKASPAFTREVMRKARAQAHEPARPFVWRMAAGLAMAACLIAVIQLTVMQQRQHDRTIALREERQQIEAELAAVKKIADQAEPVVVLENDRGTRVILDLDSAIQPASLNYD